MSYGLFIYLFIYLFICNPSKFLPNPAKSLQSYQSQGMAIFAAIFTMYSSLVCRLKWALTRFRFRFINMIPK